MAGTQAGECAPIVREGLRLILETAPEIEVVGEANDGAALTVSEPQFC